MNNTKFSINEHQIVTTQIISSFTVSVSNVFLFESANLQVRLFDNNNNIANVFPLTLTGTDYTNWGGDDTYLYQYVADKMGYTLSSVPDVSVPDIPVPVPDVPVLDIPVPEVEAPVSDVSDVPEVEAPVSDVPVTDASV